MESGCMSLVGSIISFALLEPHHWLLIQHGWHPWEREGHGLAQLSGLKPMLHHPGPGDAYCARKPAMWPLDLPIMPWSTDVGLGTAPRLRNVK